MAKARKYQNGQVVAKPVTSKVPKYKILLDGREVEFTDEELDNAWSNDALKTIMSKGGLREDDINARYKQFKDQATAGTYGFDTTPS